MPPPTHPYAAAHCAPACPTCLALAGCLCRGRWMPASWTWACHPCRCVCVAGGGQSGAWVGEWMTAAWMLPHRGTCSHTYLHRMMTHAVTLTCISWWEWQSVAGQVPWSTGWLVGWLVGWSACWLVGCLLAFAWVGWLVSLSVGCPTQSFALCRWTCLSVASVSCGTGPWTCAWTPGQG